MIIRTGVLARAVALRVADGTNIESSPTTVPGPSVARTRPRLRISTVPSTIDATPSAASPSSNNVDPASASIIATSRSSCSRSSSTTSRNGHTDRIAGDGTPFTLVLPDRGRLAGQEAVVGPDAAELAERASWLLRLPLETPTIPFDDERTGCTLWLKLEYLLPSGCTKDRMATNIVAHAIESGEVRASTVVVEASSGSTSIALGMVCATVGVRFRAYMPKTVSGERVMMIRRLGGEVILTPAEEGMDGAIAALSGTRPTRPTCTPSGSSRTPATCSPTSTRPGPSSSSRSGGRLDAFVAGVGTGGTLMGVALALRERGHATVIAEALPTASLTPEGDREVVGGIPGIVAGHEPAARRRRRSGSTNPCGSRRQRR